jgi:hypothetical protein
MVVCRSKAGHEVLPKAPKARAPVPSAVGRAYGQLLELPVALVLALMWAVGAVLLCSGALALYLAVRVLARSVAGIP